MTLRLVAAGCVSASEEAAELLDAAPDRGTLDAWLARREVGEPLAWIVGSTVFCGRRIHVVPGVYVPRPQTEELAHRAAAALPADGVAVDLCTGAGAIAAYLLAASPGATVIGVDLDPVAAHCAGRNGVPMIVADLGAPLRTRPDVDVVTAVAPYVPTADIRLLPSDVQRYEPRVALDGGADGLDLVRGVIAAAGGLLRPGGSVLIEIGGEQDDALGDAFAAARLDVVERWYDEDDDLRGIAATRR